MSKYEYIYEPLELEDELVYENARYRYVGVKTSSAIVKFSKLLDIEGESWIKEDFELFIWEAHTYICTK